ncbi:hypothetical protein SAY86_026162 [Trapa natans]|uniref:Uncharacterized protein n=1 Tax=Trapa natans TaxID=22666 RepID=A0AAN7KFD4_TRANT|nr:hypothetical protein SAY86_026162 [Trapa natans]
MAWITCLTAAPFMEPLKINTWTRELRRRGLLSGHTVSLEIAANKSLDHN